MDEYIFSNFWFLEELLYYLPLWLHQFIFPPTVYECSLCSTSCQYLLSPAFWIITILTGVRCYFIVVLVYIFPIIRDGEHPFLCLLAICMSFLEKCLFGSSTFFFFFFNQAGFVVTVTEMCVYFKYILNINLLVDMSFANIFAHSVGCLLVLFPCCAEAF